MPVRSLPRIIVVCEGDNLCFSDSIHPTAQGYSVLMQNYLNARRDMGWDFAVGSNPLSGETIIGRTIDAYQGVRRLGNSSSKNSRSDQAGDDPVPRSVHVDEVVGEISGIQLCAVSADATVGGDIDKSVAKSCPIAAHG